MSKLFIQEGHKKDMYFVCKNTKEDKYEIVNIFYSKQNAMAYIQKNSIKE